MSMRSLLAFPTKFATAGAGGHDPLTPTGARTEFGQQRAGLIDRDRRKQRRRLLKQEAMLQ
jgi:hypothetical protein